MSQHHPPRVLSIGGSDSGGSAGIQADLKTYEACGVFGMTALTVVTAQNTLGIQAVHVLPPDFVATQMQAVLGDMGANAIKTGLLMAREVIGAILPLLDAYPDIPLVVDPVLVNGKGEVFVSPAMIEAYRTELLPRATIITPNLDEAALLADQPLPATLEEMVKLAYRLHECGAKHVVIKGGHLAHDPISPQITNLFFDGAACHFLTAERLPVVNPHGVGCTFASATAAALAKGLPPLEAVTFAHEFLHQALAGSIGWQLGAGRLPVNHHFTRDILS